MPVRPTYPGVYVEEVPSGVRTVAGVATATAAFVGSFPRGLLDRAVTLRSLADFEREYGGLAADHETSYAIQQFFLNGGSECIVVRVASANAAAARATLANGLGNNILRFVAGRQHLGQSGENPGLWGNDLRVEVDLATRPPRSSDETGQLFNLTVSLVRQDGDRTAILASERFVNLLMQDGPENALATVNAASLLVQLDRQGLAALPAQFARPAPSGTVSGAFPAGHLAPNAATSLQATVTIAGNPTAIPAFSIAATPAPRRLADWAANFQTALRAQATVLPLAQQPYLSEATVEVVGSNLADDPARLVIRLGRGARPFDPGATIGFAGTALADYLLDTGAGVAAAQRAIVSPQQFVPTTQGADGTLPVAVTRYRGARAAKTGLYALEDVDLFNILCLPDAAAMSGADMRALYAEATAYCEERRSMLLVDIPAATVRLDQMQAWLADNATLRHPNAVVYYPRTRVPDPLNGGRLRSLGPSGTIAGLYARTDAQRGVWKAPAGTEARLRNVQALDYVLTDLENGALNPLGVNCLRTFPVYASICWGARTLEGADALASDWKYVPVRRLTLFLEESLYRGTQWVVFEPNDEPLWAQIRLNVGAFMHDLFRKGAFQGSTPRDAFFVRCDGTTTTQTDIDNGIVNIEVGFAPLKPAEFVILKIQQIARRAEI
ncbi:MAG: phage tail sheath C-terminal domain-containing protein [Sphingomonadaceae bacterium]